MRNKKIFDNLKVNYRKSPNKILDMGLSTSAIAVFELMLRMPVNFDPSLSFIKSRLDISKPTIIKAIKELIQHNIIRLVIQGGIGRLSEYEFIDPEYWR